VVNSQFSIVNSQKEQTVTTGLILVDIQNDYFPGGKMELVGMTPAAAKAKELLDRFRNRGWPTFHIQHIAARPGATFFLPQTEGAELHETIEPLTGERVILKHFPNSFRETDLLDAIHEAEVDRVVICGAMSHMCIDATTRAAFDFGLSCTVIHNACATRNLEFNGKTVTADSVHGAFMAALGAAYARVLSCQEFAKEVVK
jgi:nicotinamidase-related amidase